MRRFMIILGALVLAPLPARSTAAEPGQLHFEVHPTTLARAATPAASASSPVTVEPIGDRLHIIQHPAAQAPSVAAARATASRTASMIGSKTPAQPADFAARPERQAQTAALNPTFGTYHSPNGLGWFGYSASGVGDVDNDGYADFVATTLLPAPAGGYGAYLYRGGPSGPDRPSWQYEGLVYAMKVAAAGDVNGDGYDDVLFSTQGRLEVRYGHSYGLNNAADFIGNLNGFGFSAQTAGDVNGDGYADIVAGAPTLPTGAQAILYFGSATGLSAANFQLVSAAWNNGGADRFGYSVAGIGDMNGDGYGDVAFGAPDGGVTNTNGAAWIGFGSATGIILPIYTGFGSGILGCYEWGTVVGPAGDLNGDGYADLLVSDPTVADGYGGAPGYMKVIAGAPGTTYTGLYAGGGYAVTDDHVGGDLFTGGDLNGDGMADALVVAPQGGYIRILELNGLDYLSDVGPLNIGASAWNTARAAGDLNGDGFSDIVVGKPEQGEVRVYYGMADKPGAALFHRPGSQDNEVSGWSVAMGDVNGDGYDDVAVGKPNHTGVNGYQCGAIDLYLGGPDSLAATPVWSAEGFAANDGLGGALSIGQDENGDGYGDILAGAGSGSKAVLVYGRKDWQADPTPTGWYYQGPIGALAGASVAFAGDVNGDGFADVLVGEPNYTDPSAPAIPRVGRVTLLLGAATIATISPWSPLGIQAEMRQGASVASAGDMNRDGYSDIIIGTPYFDDGGAVDAGSILAYYGGPGGPGSPILGLWGGAGWMVGNSVAGIGDFDRDGFGDIAFGCPGANSIGRAYVVRGDLSSGATWWLWDGPAWGFAAAVAPAGDVDGDGSSDLLVGDVFFDGAAGQDCGRMQVYPGGASAGGPAIAAWEGVSVVDNLGHAVAGGGDVNGDGFADVVGGEPRYFANGFFDCGAFAVGMGNAARGATTRTGRARPTRQGRPFGPSLPLGIYGTSSQDTRIGLTSLTSSPGGRDRVAVEYRVSPIPGGSGGNWARTPSVAMGAPSSPHQGAVQIDATPSALVAGNAYGWTLRHISRSPYFRYGAWLNPQPNARGQWDVRTRSGTVAVDPTANPMISLEMRAPWPSPAHGDAHVAFAMPRAGDVELAVRDVQGRLVRRLASSRLEAGRHELTWNGNDESGRRCAAGLYFLDLRLGDERATQRLVLAR